MGLGSLTCFLFRTWHEGPISSVKPCRCMLLSFYTFSCAAFPLHFLFWLPVVFSFREPRFLVFSSWKGFDSLGWFSPWLFGCLPYPSLISQQNPPPPTSSYTQVLMCKEVRLHCSLWHFHLSLFRLSVCCFYAFLFLPACLSVSLFPLGVSWWDSAGRES